MLLDGFKGSDEAGRIVSSEKIPGVEAGEVLKSSQYLIAADYSDDQQSASLRNAGYGGCPDLLSQ